MRDLCYSLGTVILRSYKQLEDLRKSNAAEKIVMLHGVFDLLHVGHLNILQRSKKMGDILVVCVISDEQTQMAKGGSRPIIRQLNRAKMLDALKCVDYVFLNPRLDFKDDSMWPGYILRPNLITSGDRRWYHSDQKALEMGIKSKILNRGKFSTTQIVEEIKNQK